MDEDSFLFILKRKFLLSLIWILNPKAELAIYTGMQIRKMCKFMQNVENFSGGDPISLFRLTDDVPFSS